MKVILDRVTASDRRHAIEHENVPRLNVHELTLEHIELLGTVATAAPYRLVVVVCIRRLTYDVRVPAVVLVLRYIAGTRPRTLTIGGLHRYRVVVRRATAQPICERLDVGNEPAGDTRSR